MGDQVVDVDLALHIPVYNFGHIGAAPCTTKGRAFPLAASDQLKRAGRDFRTRLSHANDDAAAGAEISTRPFQLVTGRKWEGSAFGGARGRTDVPKIVDWYMEGKINIDDLITHTMPLEDINKGFDLMKSGESIRGVVLF